MRTIKCARCGKILQASGEITLCGECRAVAKQETVLRTRTCRTCGAEFIGGPRAWYCPSCRAERIKEQRRHRKAANRKLGSIDYCEICGKEYIVNGGLQRYCPDCKAEAVAVKDRAQGRAYMQEHKQKYYERKREGQKNRKVCVVCGKQFWTGNTDVTCSAHCAAILKSQKQREADFRRGRRRSIEPYESGLPQSGIVGVTARRNGKWQACYKQKYLGVYDTIDDAARAIEKEKARKIAET